MFKATFSLKISERDNYTNGCDPFNSHTSFIDDLSFESDNLASLLSDICKHFNVTMNSIMLNSCDEIGRIDVQTYTKTLKGNKCTYNAHKKGFIDGKFDLYLNCFIGEIVRKPVLVDLLDSENFKL